MFGFDAFSTAPLGSVRDPNLQSHFVGAAEFLPGYKRVTTHFKGTASIRTSADNRIFAATDDYISQPGDRIPSRLFAGTVRQALRFSRSIFGSGDFGSYTLGLGEAILSNAGGEYDPLIGTHALDGRPIVIRLGDANEAHDTFGTVFDGQSTGYQVNGAEFVIDLRDNGYLLEVPVSAATFAGTGGIEGDEDLKGRRKPVPLGFCRNVTPALINRQKWVFAVADAAVHGISAVYQRGAALGAAGPDYPTYEALIAAEVPDGGFVTCLASGLFRVDFIADADVGQTTCDVEGLVVDGVYARSTAEVVTVLAKRVGGIALDLASFARVQAAQPASVNFFVGVGEETTIAAAMARLAIGIGGWVGFRRSGKLELGILSETTGSALTSFDDIDIIEIDRDRLPDAIEPPAYRYRAAYARNWTVQTDNFAGSVSEDRRTFLREPFRVSEPAEDQRIKINHPLAQDPPPIETFFDEEAPAKAECERRLRFFRSARSVYRLSARARPFGLDLGDEIHVTYPRWDLAAGKSFRVVSIDEDTENNIIEIVGYG